VRVVVGAARRDTDEADVQLLQQAQELDRLTQVELQRVVGVAAEGKRIAAFVLLCYPRTIRPWPERLGVKRAQPHTDTQPRRIAADAGHQLTQEACAVLEAAAVAPLPVERA